nr:cullin-7-like [Chrysemys picta bellii]
MELLSLQEGQPRGVRSIFQPKAPACAAVQVASCPPQKEASAFKTRSAFPSRSSYVEYVQGNLVRGMRVRMLEDYEQVSAGDEGEFRQSNDGTPPVQVYWQALGRTYWVHWHMVEIVSSSGQAEWEVQEKVSSLTENLKLTTVTQTFYCKPLGGLYSLPYLTERPSEDSEALSRAEWWELLFFVKKLDPHEQQEVAQLIRQHQEVKGEGTGGDQTAARPSFPSAAARYPCHRACLPRATRAVYSRGSRLERKALFVPGLPASSPSVLLDTPLSPSRALNSQQQFGFAPQTLLLLW